MKKFSLATLFFAGYAIFNDGHIEKADGTKIVADPKGNVTLVCSEDCTIATKKYKAGKPVTIKLTDLMSWVEDTDWEEVPAAPVAGEADAEKEAAKEAKKKVKELEGNVTKASEALIEAVMSGKPTTGLTEAVSAAKKELADYIAANPTATKAKSTSTKAAKVEVVYTDAEKEAIAGYEAKKAEFDLAKTALETAKTEMGVAKEALPSSYKVKGNASTGVGGGPKPPKMTDAIRAEIKKAAKGEAYTAQGKEYPAVEVAEKTAQIARNFGYSGAYTAAQIKK